MAQPAKKRPRTGEQGAPSAARLSGRGKGIRISDELFEQADEHAGIAQRSVPKQIEYWSQLGRLLEQDLGSADLHALLSKRKMIADITLASNEVPDAATVLAELEAERAAGTLSVAVTTSGTVYDMSDDGRLRRHAPDGSVEHGQLVDGAFVVTPAA